MITGLAAGAQRWTHYGLRSSWWRHSHLWHLNRDRWGSSRLGVRPVAICTRLAGIGVQHCQAGRAVGDWGAPASSGSHAPPRVARCWSGPLPFPSGPRRYLRRGLRGRRVLAEKQTQTAATSPTSPWRRLSCTLLLPSALRLGLGKKADRTRHEYGS